MVRTPVWPLAGVVVALGLAGCAASPLYVPSPHRGTVGEIPRDGNGEPMWEAIPRPLYVVPAPNIPPAPGIPITGPGVAEMRAVQPAPAYAAPSAPAYAAPAPVYTAPAPAYAAPNAPVPITGPGVAEMRAAPPVYAPQVYAAPATADAARAAPPPASVAAAAPLYPASPRSSYMLSPLSPNASPSEIRKRARDRRRACAHLRTCE